MKPGGWRFRRVLSHKLQGHVWVVEDTAGHKGYFKFARPEQWHYAGPAIANEWIAACLARHLGFPVAKLALAQIAGPDGVLERGVVSAGVQAWDVTTWQEADPIVRQRPETWLYRLHRLRQLVVFDAWTANVDRGNGRNLVLYRPRGQWRYRWYLIDHALALLGGPCKWERHPWSSAYWDDLWRYHHVAQGLLRLHSWWPALEPMIERIERMAPRAVHAIVTRAPAGTISDALRHETTRLLLHRQARLRTILLRWLGYPGVKEFRAPHLGR